MGLVEQGRPGQGTQAHGVSPEPDLPSRCLRTVAVAVRVLLATGQQRVTVGPDRGAGCEKHQTEPLCAEAGKT